jgi:hypothetical protein
MWSQKAWMTLCGALWSLHLGLQVARFMCFFDKQRQAISK